MHLFRSVVVMVEGRLTDGTRADVGTPVKHIAQGGDGIV